MEKTLALIKPDGVERNLIGRILSFYEEKNLTISQIKMLIPTIEIVQEHYKEHIGKPYFNDLVDFFTKGKVVALVIEGINAIELVRKLNGNTDPIIAELGSIRGKFGNDKTHNLVHGSDSPKSAERELKIWFPEIF